LDSGLGRGYFVAVVTRILALAACLVLCTCAPRNTSAHHLPSLSRADAEQLMLRADDIRRVALSDLSADRLSEVFRGRALQMLEAQAQVLDRRGIRAEERSASRALVFWDPSVGEAVLEVVAERRFVPTDEPDQAWTATVRQWWARLQSADGRWWVVDQQDLPPDRWRQSRPPS
jgi:hypothetical protein